MPIEESMRSKLERGDVVTESTEGQGGRKDARAFALLAAPVERVWDAITDYDHYKDFMPLTKASRVKRREGDTVWFYTELSMLLKTCSYEIKLTLEKPKWRASWTLVESNMLRANEGSWQLESTPAGETYAVYTAYVAPSLPVPEMILNKLTKGTLPQLMAAVRKRVGDRKYG